MIDAQRVADRRRRPFQETDPAADEPRLKDGVETDLLLGPDGGQLEAAAPDGDDDRLERLAAALGVQFRDLGHLRLALTHRSVLHEWSEAGWLGFPLQSNERLEFLGDAVLGALVAEYLYATDPEADEGTLTRRRAALVRTETLVRWAREIDLGPHLYLGHGERPSEGHRDRMLAGAFEALVGAITVDRGMHGARRFVRRFLAREIPAIVQQASQESNPKGHLQELLQERYRRPPTYETVTVVGPDHARVFTVSVTLDGRPFGTGSGGSKREAQQAAARAGLAFLDSGGDPLRGGAERGPDRS